LPKIGAAIVEVLSV